jgi:IS5 family transposase
MKALTVFHNLKGIVSFLYKQLNLKTFEKATGRKRSLTNQDVITLALYKHTQGIPTKKQIYNDFKPVCTYKTFCESVNRLLPVILRILLVLIAVNRKDAHLIKYTDSTDISVCLNKNAKYHKTMRGLATWGRGSKGFYYGLKLHVTTDFNGRLLSIKFTASNVDDRKVFMKLNERLKGLFIADAGYISKKLADEFYIDRERLLMAKPKANMRKVATPLQNLLYSTRARVETIFNNTKKFRGLVSSLPRSIDGYLGNYICALLAEVLA